MIDNATAETGARIRNPRVILRSGLAASRIRDYGVVISLVALFIALAIASPPFLHTSNLLNILDQWSSDGIMALGITVLLIAGGFDLSAGVVYALAGAIAAKVAIADGAVVGLVAGCLSGLAVGIINGLIVNFGRVNAFIATLSTSIMATGAALAITNNGLTINVTSPAFSAVGTQSLVGVPYVVWILLAAIVIFAVLLHRTTFGRYVFALGGNAEAARLSGVRIAMVSIGAFGISGLCAGIGGTLAASSVSAGEPNSGGYGLLFNIFAIVVIGGTSISGGSGAIWRTVVGLLLLALIGNGFNLLAVGQVYQSIVLGALILLAVLLDVWSRSDRSS